MAIINNKSTLVRFLSGADIESAFGESERLINQYVKDRSIAEMGYWLPWKSDPLSRAPLSLTDVLKYFQAHSKSRSPLFFQWRTGERHACESWIVWIYLNGICHLECVFDIGSRPFEEADRRLIESDVIDILVMEKDHGYFGTAAGLYFFHKIHSSRRLKRMYRHVDGGEPCSLRNVFSVLPEAADECITLGNHKKDIRDFLENWDRLLSGVVRTDAFQKLLDRLGYTEEQWLRLRP